MLIVKRRFCHSVIYLIALPLFAQSSRQPIEPKAGSWKTWVISSGKDFRVPPPPDAATTAGELKWLRDAVAEPNPYIAASVQFWSAGAPAYRWIELINNRALSGAPLSAFAPRLY